MLDALLGDYFICFMSFFCSGAVLSTAKKDTEIMGEATSDFHHIQRPHAWRQSSDFSTLHGGSSVFYLVIDVSCRKDHRQLPVAD